MPTKEKFFKASSKAKEYLPKNAKAELVRNPYIALYLKANPSLLDEDKEYKFKVVNNDEKHCFEVSLANNFYKYTNKIREVTNIRYLEESCGLIPEDYIESKREDSSKELIVPYDYILITRSDGTQFLISEDYDSANKENSMHKYWVVRYIGGNELFREDVIYSDGIDLSRLLSGDQEYINVFADEFLSERRLNETLMTVYSALDIQSLDETDHGGQYAGYIDSFNLTINSSFEKTGLLFFEKRLREGGTI